MRFRSMLRLSLLAAIALTPGCWNDQGLDPNTVGKSAQIAIADTTLVTGETASFFVTVQYVFGPGQPSSVLWSLTDTSVATLDIISDGSAYLTAKRAGATKLIAFVNKAFTDTSSVAIVATGSVRWRQDLGATSVSSVALDDSDNVFVATMANSTPTLTSYTSSGELRWSVPSCFNLISASVREDNGAIMTSGQGAAAPCTRRHDRTGATIWTGAVGSVDGGAALTADDGLIALSSVGTQAAGGAVVVSRFNAAGSELWRDTLDSQPLVQQQTPAVAQNGDIYVPWRSPTANDSNFLSRLTSAGVVRWTKPLPGWPHYTGPAIDQGHVYVAHQGGVVAFDTAGAVVWSFSYPAVTETSSPVVDAAGNVYTQSAALRSFTSTGTVRWTADTLGGGSTQPTGAPSVLANGAVVVQCSSGEVCAVNTTDGSLLWKSALGGGVGGTVAVASDGTLLVERATSGGSVELVALWNRALPVLAGWPTEGHDMQRSRREF